MSINSTLYFLDKSDNKIGAEGAGSIGNALNTNTTLSSLHLSGNEIGYEGAASIANALKTNTALSFLHLSNNEIGDEGAESIANALSTSTTLSSLNLSNNKIHFIPDEFADARSLKILSFRVNPLKFPPKYTTSNHFNQWITCANFCEKSGPAPTR